MALLYNRSIRLFLFLKSAAALTRILLDILLLKFTRSPYGEAYSNKSFNLARILASCLLAEIAVYHGLNYSSILRSQSPWLTLSSLDLPEEDYSPAEAFDSNPPSTPIEVYSSNSPSVKAYRSTTTMVEPTFTFCRRFNRKNQLVSRWLKSFNYKLRYSNVKLQAYLEYLDLLL